MQLRLLPCLPMTSSIQGEGIATPNGDAGKPPAPEHQDTFTNYSSPTENTSAPPGSIFHQRRHAKPKYFVVGILLLVAFLGIHYVTNTTTEDKNAQDASAHSLDPPRRVRKSWKTYTEAEKQHYLKAVQIAMEKGYHYRFVQIHMAQMNRITSHGACPFLLWHRRFILGYENMLRSLAPEFANLTLPYWNYFEDTNRQLATDVLCDSLESCSEFLRDMGGGGLTDGRAGENMTIEHVDLEIGTCVSKGIAGHACNHPDGTASGVCRNCIMRGNWRNPRKIVQALGPDLLRVLDVFNSTADDETDEGAHALLSHKIEKTFHNAVHNTLNSTMRYTSSAFDPIFIGHHAMVDLTQLIFNMCKYIENVSVEIDWKHEKRETRFDVFKACDVEDENVFNYTSFGNETMYMTFRGVPVKEDPFMTQFFSGYGDKYADVANAEDLGPENSYTYTIDPFLEQLLERHSVKCPPYLYESQGPSRSRKLREDGGADDRTAALELIATLATCGDAIRVRYPHLSISQRLEQEGIIKCLVVEERSGGVLEDYDDAFRSMMKVPANDSPYCVKLLKRLRSGELRLLASDECLRDYGAKTGVNLIAKAARMLTPS